MSAVTWTCWFPVKIGIRFCGLFNKMKGGVTSSPVTVDSHAKHAPA
jgi:hypothetical protein